MIESNKYFQLFSCCVPVKGYSKSTIIDIQRSKLFEIPNSLHDLILNYPDRTYDQLSSEFDTQIEILDRYFHFLLENELGFWTAEPDLFPKIEMTWNSPEKINNAILELDIINLEQIDSILKQLDDLHCKHLELRFYNGNFEKLQTTIEFISKTSIRGVVIYFKYSSAVNKNIVELLIKNNRIVFLYLHSIPENLVDSISLNTDRLVCSKDKIESSLHCGNIEKGTFSSYIEVFSEAQSNNSCLNKKVSIDSLGNIKNCPSLDRSYGNIESITIKEVVEMPEFQELWSLNKDKILVCKDCEYRYVCTDCRAYVQDPSDLISKPLKCGYNPYNGKWGDWKENPVNQKAIKFYDMDSMFESL